MKKNSYFCNLCPCFNFILIAFFLLLLYHDLRYGNQPLFFESLKMFSQDTWVCGMPHSLSGVFMTQTQNDIYYIKNSIYIPVLEILSLTFAQGLITSFKSMLFCVLTCLKLCSFFLTSGSLEIQFFKKFIIFIIVWNKLIPFLLHFLGSFYLYIIKFWFNLHSYETPFCKAALATVQSGFIFSYTHMYTYTSAVKLRKFVYLIEWNIWMVWKIKRFNVI